MAELLIYWILHYYVWHYIVSIVETTTYTQRSVTAFFVRSFFPASSPPFPSSFASCFNDFLFFFCSHQFGMDYCHYDYHLSIFRFFYFSIFMLLFSQFTAQLNCDWHVTQHTHNIMINGPDQHLICIMYIEKCLSTS